jgi:hypothetical protein
LCGNSGGIRPLGSSKRSTGSSCRGVCKPGVAQLHRRKTSSVEEHLVIFKKSSRRKKSTVRVLWRGLVKSHQPLDLSKRRGGYDHVRSSSSRGREPLDHGSVTHQSSDLTGVAQGLNPREQSKNPKRHRNIEPSEFGKLRFTRAEDREFP